MFSQIAIRMKSSSPVVVSVAVNRSWSIAVDLGAPTLRVSRVWDPGNPVHRLGSWEIRAKATVYRQQPANWDTKCIYSEGMCEVTVSLMHTPGRCALFRYKKPCKPNNPTF